MTTTTSTPTTYSIPGDRLPALRERFAQLAKRAAKLGLPAPRLVEDGTRVARVAEWSDETFQGHRAPISGEMDLETHRGLGHQIPTTVRHLVHVEGTRPVLDGWSLRAALQHLVGPDGEPVVLFRARADLDPAVREAYRAATPDNCDHCHIRIRTRKETFLLVNEDRRTVQIGRSCLQDFLPRASLTDLVDSFEFELSAEDACAEACSDGDLYSTSSSYGVEDFLAQTAAVIRLDGWVSKASSDMSIGRAATVMTAEDLLIPPKPPTTKWQRLAETYRPTDADRAIARETIAWATEILPHQESISDYEYNLSVICGQVVVPARGEALLASAVAAYLRHLGREIERRTQALASHHVGVMGGKLTVPATLQALIAIEGDYGTSHLHRFFTDDGAILVWFASNKDIVYVATDSACSVSVHGPEWGICGICGDTGRYIRHDSRSIEIGETVTLRGTVKRHDIRNGIAQTILTRCTVPTAVALALESEKAAKKAAREAKKAAKAGA